MKKTLILLCSMLLSFVAFSQSNYYYYKGKTKPLTVDKSKVNVFITNQFQKSSVTNLTAKDFKIKNTDTANEKWATIDFGTQLNDLEFIQKVNALRNNTEIVGIGYHYKDRDSKTVGTSNQFYIKLKKPQDLSLLQQQAASNNATVLKSLDSDNIWYSVKTSRNSESSIELANRFIATGLFDEMDAAFMLHFVHDGGNNTMVASTTNSSTTTNCVNDPEFNLQWGLNNATNPAVDINACQAWSIPGATGSGVKVGVVDAGIKLNHPDLAANIHPESYNSNTQTQPSVLSDQQVYFFHDPHFGTDVPYKDNHGSQVAGIIGAVRNNTDICGVAPQCKIVAVSNNYGVGEDWDPNYNSSFTFGEGIRWAANEGGADIINCSWYIDNVGFNTTFLEYQILDALNSGRDGKGCIVVFCSGNFAPTNNYPTYIDPRIMVVGAVNNTGTRAPFSAYQVDSSDEISSNTDIDVVAPGVDVRTLITNFFSFTPDNGTLIDERTCSGTSYAAPHVSGTAALVLSVNPCLTGQEVRNIIEKTAQKVGGYNYVNMPGRPNGTWNNEVGYGLIDAYAATQMAKTLAGTHLDLYIKDNAADSGIEPNTTTATLWNSPNIWVRNNPDGLTTPIHQAPRYNQTTPNYVYVKVENKSCYPTTGNEQVQLYYSRPSSNSPTSTSAAFRSSFAPVTGTEWVLIGTENMPSLDAGKGKTLEFPWSLPDPIGMYGCTSTTFNTSLLAKIVANSDSNTVAETTNVLTNIRNSNNIAGKSLIAIDSNNFAATTDDNTTANAILVANPYNEPHSFSIEMIKEDLETGKPIYQEAEVSFKMDDALYNAWERGGKTAQNIEATAVESKKMVTNNNVLINTISLNANEMTTLKLNFNFLTDELTDKSKYMYHIIQRDLATNEIVSAVAFEINKEPRPIFEAVADDIEKDRNEIITISAEQISEPALYNWYDTDGNLIYQGKDLTVATDVAQKYKLEVIATADGFKDYTEVEVTLKPSVLSTFTPNPATDAATIGYKINEGGTAYLMILGGYGSDSSSNNYILNPDLGEIKINLANYSNGFYTVALVINGQIIDAKTLVKQ